MITPEQHAEIRRLYYGEHRKVGTIIRAVSTSSPSGEDLEAAGVSCEGRPSRG